MSLTEWVNGISEFIFISKKKPSRQYDKEKSFSEVYIGDWSVYPVESLRQSAAVHSHPQEGVAKQPNHSYLSVSDWVKVPVKHSRQLYGQTGKSTLVWFYHRCLLVSLFLLWEVAGRQIDPWAVLGTTEKHSTGFSACHGQVLWIVRAGNQAGLCWHVWDLQLSAGEICTAESAGGGRRVGVGMRPVGKQGSMAREGEKAGKLPW